MSLSVPKQYKVTSVEKTPEPTGSTGSWYKYVISNRGSTITGQRCGTLKQVTKHAEDFADQLNNRPSRGITLGYAAQKKGRPASTT
jgi:hypothetical protein